jgi:hypothetical protein
MTTLLSAASDRCSTLAFYFSSSLTFASSSSIFYSNVFDIRTLDKLSQSNVSYFLSYCVNVDFASMPYL